MVIMRGVVAVSSQPSHNNFSIGLNISLHSVSSPELKEVPNNTLAFSPAMAKFGTGCRSIQIDIVNIKIGGSLY
jgi:hypothetical protein